MIVLGIVMMRAGFRVFRGSGSGAVLAIWVAGVNILVVGSWLVFAIFHGMFSPLTLGVFALSSVTLAASAAASPALRTVDAARARLRAEGLECGDVRPLLRPIRMSKWKWALVAVVCGCVAATAVYRYVHRPFDPHSMPVAELLEQNLSGWTTSIGTPEAAAFAQRLQTSEARKLLGEDVSRSISVLLDRGIALAQAKTEEVETRGHEFVESQSAVNQALASKGLPLFVDGSVVPSGAGVTPLIMTYYIEREESFEFRGQPLRAVSAWRMDPMRVRLPALGYVRGTNPAAIISYDLIEAVLVLHLLPSLVDNEPAFVFDEPTRFQGDPQVLQIETRLGNVVRQHFGAVRQDADTRRLGELLAQRRNLIAKWRRTITGFSILPPERLIPERNLGTRLESYISRTEAMQWDEISDELLNPRILTAFERQRSELSNAIERHELQHLVDQKDRLSGIPVALARRLRVDASAEPEPYSLFGAARSELSAYLAQVADVADSRLSLVQLSSAVFDRNLRGQPHHFAAAALFDGLMKSLHVTDDRPSYNEAVVRVIECEPATIRAEARNLYEEWFGRPLATVVRIKSVEHTRWRH
jgi:hypothetical protein